MILLCSFLCGLSFFASFWFLLFYFKSRVCYLMVFRWTIAFSPLDLFLFSDIGFAFSGKTVIVGNLRLFQVKGDRMGFCLLSIPGSINSFSIVIKLIKHNNQIQSCAIDQEIRSWDLCLGIVHEDLQRRELEYTGVDAQDLEIYLSLLTRIQSNCFASLTDAK